MKEEDKKSKIQIMNEQLEKQKLINAEEERLEKERWAKEAEEKAAEERKAAREAKYVLIQFLLIMDLGAIGGTSKRHSD